MNHCRARAGLARRGKVRFIHAKPDSAMRLKTIASLIAALLVVLSTASAGTGPVFVNNYDANFPIYLYNLAGPIGPVPNDGSFYIQIFAGSDGGSLVSIIPSTPLISADPGFFDFGFTDTGLPDHGSGYFRLRVWAGDLGSTYDSSVIRNELDWTQTVGSYSASTGVPPFPQPSSLTFGVPEPSSVALFVLGGLALALRRRRP